MNRFATLFDSLGATLKPGADAATIARAEEVLAVRFPEEFRELYQTTDGVVLADLQLEITPLATVRMYAGFLAKGFGYAPFTDCNDSNPYAVCCDEPLIGFVVLLSRLSMRRQIGRPEHTESGLWTPCTVSTKSSDR